jgi:hypothetical protein
VWKYSKPVTSADAADDGATNAASNNGTRRLNRRITAGRHGHG